MSTMKFILIIVALCLIVSTNAETHCEKLRREGSRYGSSMVPSCDLLGRFRRKSCVNTRVLGRQCSCWDPETGLILFGPSSHVKSCECVVEAERAKRQNRAAPQCTYTGEYRPVQCVTRQQCSCVSANGVTLTAYSSLQQCLCRRASEGGRTSTGYFTRFCVEVRATT